MPRKNFVIILFILTSLAIAGCRVRSAGEDQDPTPRSVSANHISNSSPTPEIPISATPTTIGFTPTATLAAPTNTPTLDTGQTSISASLTPMVASPTATIQVFVLSPTSTWTSMPTATTTSSSTPTYTATVTNTATHTPTLTFTPSHTPTSTPTATPTSRFTATFTPFPPPSFTPVGASIETGIGGGDPAVQAVAPSATPTLPPPPPPPPTQVAQFAPTETLNPNQATATAFIVQATHTAAAAQGTFFPTSTPLGAGAGGAFFTPTSTPVPTQEYPDCDHYIDAGATLGSIARLYNLDEEVLAEYNGIEDVDHIEAGDILVIPGCGRIPTITPTISLTPNQTQTEAAYDNTTGPIQYTVVAGDTIYRLSVRFGVSMAELLDANPVIRDSNIDEIDIGQAITIPRRSRPLTTGTPTVTPASSGGAAG